MVRASSLALIAVAACAPAATRPAAPGRSLGPEARAEVRPLRYRLDVRAAPLTELSGRVEIDVEVSAPTSTIALSSRVRIDEASVAAAPVRIVHQGIDRIVLHTDRPVSGRATIALRFRARVGELARGAFHRRHARASYLFTQFEPDWARRAFPCFDEPRWKTPWRITLRIDPSVRAVSNAPIVSETLEDGLKVVRFAETRPLPSYLVAFAVGDLVAVDAGKTRGGAPIRVVSPRSDEAEARKVARLVAPLVEDLEDYLGIPYPFEKLDLLGVPRFNGGMENAGLITLGLDSWTEDYIIAHELAHQWFGDLVTIADWRDIWLQESFATWLGTASVLRLTRDHGERQASIDYETASSLIQDPGSVLAPLWVDDDVVARAAYEKGGAILRMVEAWVGAPRFQAVVRRYLATHAWGQVTTDDFLAALGDAAPFLPAFLTRQGSPLLEMELECPPAGPARLVVQQRAPAWRVPVCVRHDGGDRCSLVEGPRSEVVLGAACPTWLAPNRDALGYYSVLPGPALEQLLIRSAGSRLTPAERSRLLTDLMRAFVGRLLPVGRALPILVPLLGDRRLEMGRVWRGALDPMVPAELRGAYHARVAAPSSPAPRTPAATRLAWDWLKASTDAPIAREVEELFAAGDRAIFDQVRGALADPLANRSHVAFALGLFRDPALARAATDLAGSGALADPAIRAMLRAMLRATETMPYAQAFVVGRPAERRYLPSTWLPYLVRTICDEATLAAARRWVSPAMRLERSLAEAGRCVELRRFHEPSLRAYLSSGAAPPGR